tara:strand:- start:441 stop:977 length:537 start_codon:yes stop_codon:yes gene_type:complete
MLKAYKKSIGIFGGSFDPPHEGHLKISSVSIKKLKLKKLYWIITNKNPFKKKSFFNIDKRLSLSKNLTKKNKKIKVIFIEKKIKSNRTIDVLKYLVKKNKKSQFFLIIGSDNLIKFHKWQKWKLISSISKLVVFARDGFDRKARKSIAIRKIGAKKIVFIRDSKVNISSSKLRKNYLL